MGWDDWERCSRWTTRHDTRTGLAWEVGVWNTIKVHMFVARIIRSTVRVIGECICNEIWDEIKDEFRDRGNTIPPLSLRDETIY